MLSLVPLFRVTMKVAEVGVWWQRITKKKREWVANPKTNPTNTAITTMESTCAGKRQLHGTTNDQLIMPWLVFDWQLSLCISTHQHINIHSTSPILQERPGSQVAPSPVRIGGSQNVWLNNSLHHCLILATPLETLPFPTSLQLHWTIITLYLHPYTLTRKFQLKYFLAPSTQGVHVKSGGNSIAFVWWLGESVGI